jgi:SPP1 gp7 family putative phage head morphogenesis protein
VGCDCHPVTLSVPDQNAPHFNKKIFDLATRHIFDKKEYTSGMLNDKPIKALIAETNRVLTKAVDHGLKDNLPEAEMIAKLKNDVFVFSTCKTHIQLKEVSSLLTDESGKIKGYDKFSQDVTALGKLYNDNYLQAEYIFATSSAEMAAKWNRFEKDGDRYNLQYRTARDTKVRDTHAKLADTTLPVGDPFWDSYFPPNGWRCRCTTVQVLKDKYPASNSVEAIKKAETATTQIDSKGRNRAEMFRFNPGKQKVIFPPNHPYYKVQQAIGNVIGSLPSPKAKLIEERRKDYLKLKKDENYKDVAFKEDNGGLKGTHINHQFDKKKGYYEKEVQNILFESGDKVILGDEKTGNGKHPEGYLNDKIFEIKTIESLTSGSIKRNLELSARKNIDTVVLYFPQSFNIEILKAGKSRFDEIARKEKLSLKSILFIHNGKVHRL